MVRIYCCMILLAVRTTSIIYAQNDSVKSYSTNPHLKTILSADQWKGNPIDKHNRFMNVGQQFKPTIGKGMKFLIGKNPQKEYKKNESFHLPVIKDTSFLNNHNDVIVWLGHASFFIRINGINILTDPIFFKSGNTKRKSPMPFDPNLLRSIDYILISHDHNDHLDKQSMQLIYQNNNRPEILSGLRMDKWMHKMLKDPKVQTAGWYQQYKTDTSEIKIYFMPARHWSKRHLWDTNKHLWGSFVIEANGKKIFFGGDSGYGCHFKQIAELCKGIDICILGIGSYKPVWFMSSNHTSPYDAVKAANEMQVKQLIPMHYGTFDFTYEPLGEPIEILKNEKRLKNLSAELVVPEVGQNYFYNSEALKNF
jgi:L-ascorbate metabolism protein UlaG (beta-lactamase superfamily)